MSASGLITMIVVVAFVWGGFAYLLVSAFRSEKRKAAAE